MLNWKIINDKYLDFLRDNYDGRIPKSDYGSEKIKPFFGELFEKDGLVYVTQVSSPKQRHEKLKSSIDFHKVYFSGRLIAVVNLNYMFPVPKSETENMNYSEIEKYRSFNSKEDKSKYIRLLQNEMKILRNMKLEEYALSIYDLKYKNPDNSVSLRCLDFKELESGANKWISINS